MRINPYFSQIGLKNSLDQLRPLFLYPLIVELHSLLIFLTILIHLTSNYYHFIASSPKLNACHIFFRPIFLFLFAYHLISLANYLFSYLGPVNFLIISILFFICLGFLIILLVLSSFFREKVEYR